MKLQIIFKILRKKLSTAEPFLSQLIWQAIFTIWIDIIQSAVYAAVSEIAEYAQCAHMW